MARYTDPETQPLLRINTSITRRQKQVLEEDARKLGISYSELLRRILDAYYSSTRGGKT